MLDFECFRYLLRNGHYGTSPSLCSQLDRLCSNYFADRIPVLYAQRSVDYSWTLYVEVIT